MAEYPRPPILSGEYGMTTGIESLCITRTFITIEQLSDDALAVEQALQSNNGKGNQWIQVLGLTDAAIETLDNDRRCLGVSFKFQWEGDTGIIKVISGCVHGMSTSYLTTYINDSLAAMGMSQQERVWGGSTTYPTSIRNQGKQPDQLFWSPSRQPVHGQVMGWPTFVIETGNSDSITKLREDAKWWFQSSSGEVRIVVLIIIEASKVVFEGWQLMEPSVPPMPREYVAGLSRRIPTNPPMPPLTAQSADTQHACRMQELTITSNGGTGGPIILPFQALFDRPAGPNEGDVSIWLRELEGFREAFLERPTSDVDLRDTQL